MCEWTMATKEFSMSEWGFKHGSSRFCLETTLLINWIIGRSVFICEGDLKSHLILFTKTKLTGKILHLQTGGLIYSDFNNTLKLTYNNTLKSIIQYS